MSWEELSRARDALLLIEEQVGVERIRAAWTPTSDANEAIRRHEALRHEVATAVACEVAAHLQEHVGDAAGVSWLLLAFADEWGPE